MDVVHYLLHCCHVSGECKGKVYTKVGIMFNAVHVCVNLRDDALSFLVAWTATAGAQRESFLSSCDCNKGHDKMTSVASPETIGDTDWRHAATTMPMA